jgi:hypothetical protein
LKLVLVVVHANEKRYIAHDPLLPDETLVVKKNWAIVIATGLLLGFIPI